MSNENTQLDRLMAAALKARANAHAPYSNHPVGAAILADNGKIYGGANVENAAHPSGQCAEASALGAMVSDGGKKVEAIVIVGPHDDLCPPCGGCRQRIYEFAMPETMVHLMVGDHIERSLPLSELLPLAFTPQKA